VLSCNELGFDGLSALATPVLVVVASSTGDGDPPDNAARFVATLKRRSQPAGVLAGVRFTVLGLGDSNYTRFCAVRTTCLVRVLACNRYMPLFLVCLWGFCTCGCVHSWQSFGSSRCHHWNRGPVYGCQVRTTKCPILCVIMDQLHPIGFSDGQRPVPRSRSVVFVILLLVSHHAQSCEGPLARHSVRSWLSLMGEGWQNRGRPAAGLEPSLLELGAPVRVASQAGVEKPGAPGGPEAPARLRRQTDPGECSATPGCLQSAAAAPFSFPSLPTRAQTDRQDPGASGTRGLCTQVPRTLVRRLEELGAERFYEPAEADEVDGFENMVEAWAAGLWPALKSAVAPAGAQVGLLPRRLSCKLRIGRATRFCVVLERVAETAQPLRPEWDEGEHQRVMTAILAMCEWEPWHSSPALPGLRIETPALRQARAGRGALIRVRLWASLGLDVLKRHPVHAQVWMS
jgi:Flavodoxin